MWSSSVCLMCLKAFDKEKENCASGPDSKLRSTCQSENSARFAVFCERFLKLPESFISKLCRNGNGGEATSNQFCLECKEVQRGTFQLYQELCEAQLKLAWRLRQWEALLENGSSQRKSGSSKKLNSLLYQKLSEQLQLDMDTKSGAKARGTKEVRKIRNLLLSHCKDARNEMVTRNLEIPLDRCSVPQGNHLGSMAMTTSFLLLDSTADVDNNFTVTNGQNVNDPVVVKMEKEFEEDFQDDLEHDADMDWEMEVGIDTIVKGENDDDDDIDAKAATTSQAPKPSTYKLRRRSAKSRIIQKKPKPNKAAPKPKRKPKSEAKLKVKKEKTHPPDWIACVLCGIAKPTPQGLWEHYKGHERRWRKENEGKTAPFQCHFCWKSLTTEQSRWLHIECHTHNFASTMKTFSCYEEPCRGAPPLPSFKDLEAHFESVHAPGSNEVFKCSLCSWPFLSDGLRQTHELIHIKRYYKEKVKCPTCGFDDYNNFSAFQNHFILQHTDLQDCKIYGCHQCTVRFSSTDALFNHLKTHDMQEDLASGSSKTYHICEHCGKRFATPTQLYKHVRIIHTTQQCSLCGEMVPTSGMRFHRKKIHKIGLSEDHACPVCQKQCYSTYLMKKHLEDVHHQGNDIEEVCHICSKKYRRMGLLHRHLRTAHQIEAPELKRPARFVCPDCGMGYYYKSSLDSHIDAKHRSLEQKKHIFPCTICSKTFCRKCLLNKHLEEAHPEWAQNSLIMNN